MHEYIGLAITIATILAATLFNNQSLNTFRAEIRADLNNYRAETNAKLDSISRDMRDLYAELARHDLRLSNLENK